MKWSVWSMKAVGFLVQKVSENSFPCTKFKYQITTDVIKILESVQCNIVFIFDVLSKNMFIFVWKCFSPQIFIIQFNRLDSERGRGKF